MSDYILRLIPDQPEFFPAVTDKKIRDQVQMFNLNANEVIINAHESIKFIDAGQNFGYILCPICREKMTVAWWQEAMNSAWLTEFIDLVSPMPCCNAKISLNDLVYEWKVGFARFCIEIHNPIRNLNDQERLSLEQLVGVKLNSIYCQL